MHAAKKTDIEFARCCGARPHFHRNSRSAQLGKALACNQGVGVLQGRDHARNTGLRQRVAAWPGAALVRARFERDICSGALRASVLALGVPQCHDLGMRAAGHLGMALTDDLACRVDQHAAYAGVGRSEIHR